MLGRERFLLRKEGKGIFDEAREDRTFFFHKFKIVEDKSKSLGEGME